MATIFHSIGAATALSATSKSNVLDSNKFHVPSRRSLSGISSFFRISDLAFGFCCYYFFFLRRVFRFFGSERKASFFCVRSELNSGSNPRARRADHLVMNAVAIQHSCPFSLSILVLGLHFSLSFFIVLNLRHWIIKF